MATLHEEHFRRLARLLEMESKAAAARVLETSRRLTAAQAERTGNSLVDLVVTDEDTGLGGRYLLTLVKRNRTLALPWSRLSVGTPVVLSVMAKTISAGQRAIVCSRNERSIRVVLNEPLDDLDDVATWRLDLSHDEVATARQRAALDRAQKASGDRLADLRRALLGERPPRTIAQPKKFTFLADLNASQQLAIAHALAADDLALIHGPPGTGKTTAVIELIRQAVARGDKVLATAPSNLAVDNLLERLVAARVRTVRLGHPARVMAALREYTLDYLVDEHPDVRVARKLVKDALTLFRKAARYTRAKPEPGARRDMRQEARALLADARRLEAQAVEHILDTSDVICATTTGLDSEVLGAREFDLAVIDEACQSTEPGCWAPIARARRVVLAGDHCQLPPTVISREAAAEGFAESLFERLVALHGDVVARRLAVQYRMHASIADFSSREFYGGELQADPSVAKHRLCDLPGVTALPLTDSPLEFIDTAGAGYDEELEPDGESRFNRGEAALIVRKVQALLESGVSARDIAVIAPYAAQVRLLRELVGQDETAADLEIDTVDGFQGREKEAILISFVRSNPNGEIGFLSDTRRTNVALTRARRKLLVVGDTATLSSDPFYVRLVEHFEKHAAYRTVWEEGV